MDDPKEEIEYNKPQPILNWKELETGKAGQPPLPGFRDKPSSAERLFLSFSGRWRTRASQGGRDQVKLIETDDIALSCLLLARKYGHTFTKVAHDDINECISTAEELRTVWLEKLPWELVSAATEGAPSESCAVERLVANLNHHNSSIRIWLADIAWCVREWLRPETAFEPLMENVATCIGGVDESWGIAATLFKSKQEFYEATDTWKLTEDAQDFASQYARRCENFKESGTTAAQAALWNTEARCWQMIAERSLALNESSEL
jgi:hypothetical protein